MYFARKTWWFTRNWQFFMLRYEGAFLIFLLHWKIRKIRVGVFCKKTPAVHEKLAIFHVSIWRSISIIPSLENMELSGGRKYSVRKPGGTHEKLASQCAYTSECSIYTILKNFRQKTISFIHSFIHCLFSGSVGQYYLKSNFHNLQRILKNCADFCNEWKRGMSTRFR